MVKWLKNRGMTMLSLDPKIILKITRLWMVFSLINAFTLKNFKNTFLHCIILKLNTDRAQEFHSDFMSCAQHMTVISDGTTQS